MRVLLGAGTSAFTELKNLCVWSKTNGGMGANRDKELAVHPTVKPVALVTDAIKDCSKRGDIVLEAFGRSGSTLIEAETRGRKARLI